MTALFRHIADRTPGASRFALPREAGDMPMPAPARCRRLARAAHYAARHFALRAVDGALPRAPPQAAWPFTGDVDGEMKDAALR